MAMNDLTKALAITLTLGLGSAALAQDTTTEAPATTTEAPAAPATEAPATEAPAPAADAPATPDAAAAPAADGVGSVYAKATHGDWEQRCVKAPEGTTDPCQIYQLLKDSDGNAVAEIGVFPLPDGEKALAGGTISAPLETLLTENLVIQIDGGKGRVYPFSWCDRSGCVARVGFTKEDLAAFKGGNKATLTIVPVTAPDQKVNLAISLKGFTAGYDALAQPAKQ